MSLANKKAKSALEALKAELPNRVLTADADLFGVSYDNLRLSIMPDALIRVEAAEEVGVVLRLANSHEIPVTARGAGSSPTGSAVPRFGGWVIDLSRLRNLNIDPLSRMATVGAGVLTADLQERAASLGLFFPPDPSSRKYSTIGGNIACNAGGMRCLKYGVTRDYVIALKGYLANGESFQWGLPLKKYCSGYNLRDLMIGSEGMLGIVTEACLRLIRQPEARWTGLFAFRDETAALERGVLRLLEAGCEPSIIEFLDRQSVACAEAYTGRALCSGVPDSSLLLIECDGLAERLGDDVAQVEEVLKPIALGSTSTWDDREAEQIWQVRRTCSQSMFHLGDTKLNEDIVVPLDRQIDLIHYTLHLKEKYGLPTPTFGHAGDGNLHVHIMYHRDRPVELEQARVGIRALMEEVVKLGGVITGEHGIGLAKSAFFGLQHTPAEIEAMRAVKRALDPKGILNPGKVFDPFEVWEYPHVDVQMPWDHR